MNHPSHEPVSVLDCVSQSDWWRFESARRGRRRAWLGAADPKKAAKRQRADLAMCSRSFLYWAQNYGFMYNPRA